MHKSLRRQLGEFLKQRRGQRTLRDFAREVGLSSSTLQRLEIGDQNITVDTLEALLRKLKLSVGDVFKQ